MNADALYDQLEQRWADLAKPRSQTGVVTMDLPSPTGYGPVLLGRSATGRVLLVPFAPDQHKVFRDDRRSAAVQLTRRPLTTDRGDRWYAEFACLRHELDSIFTAFCADVLVRIAKESRFAPTDVAGQALRHWRSLFSGSGRRLGPQALRGLFAELVVLERLVAEPGGDVLTWTGPLRDPHDFEAGPWAAEVKATGRGESVVRINGLRQLEPPANGQLALSHFQLDEDDRGRSVPEVVAALRERLGPTPLMLRLELAGYQTLDEKHYEALRLVVAQETWFRVDESFPRIVRTSFQDGEVPAGVADVHYDIDLAASNAVILDGVERDAFMDGLRTSA